MSANLLRRAATTAMAEEDAAWVRDEVIGSYHWAAWTGDWETSTPANEAHRQCEPGWVPNEPYPATLCFCVRRMGVVVGTVRRYKHWSRGYPWSICDVWLAHARDPRRLAEHAQAEADAAPLQVGQLDLFQELVTS